MRIIMGYVSLISLFFMLAKFLARKLNNPKVNLFFWKLHKPASCVFLIAAVLHFIMVLPVFLLRRQVLLASGIVLLVTSFILVALCHIQRNEKQKMLWHRILSFVLFAFVVVHVIAFFR